LLELPGVYQGAKNLRLYEQFFDPRSGPNKVRLTKVWEALSEPLLRHLFDGGTGLDEPAPHLSEEAARAQWVDIEQRQNDQKRFIKQWLLDTKGPRLSSSWKYENRVGYNEDLKRVLDEELGRFRKELDKIYSKVKEQDYGQKLVSLPAEEILKSECMSQLGVHTIPVWIEQQDPAGAFDALRLVTAAGMGKDDNESVLCFIDLITQKHDFLNGKGFWRNVYRLWLHAYASVANSEYHRKLQGLVNKYNEEHPEEEMQVTYKQVPVKTYERIKEKERQYGESTHETYQGRTLAANVLDIIRGSILVKCPRAAVTLVNDYFRPLKQSGNKLQLVRVVNRFNDRAETLAGYRNIELNVLWDGGGRSSFCGRHAHNIQVCFVGEVQIVLDSFLSIKKRRHLIYKCARGEFDWQKTDVEDHHNDLGQDDEGN
jgi:hypothetical protein